MAAIRRILAASARHALFEALQNESARRQRWSISRPVDPKNTGLFERACNRVDVALIEAEDLVWLVKNGAETVAPALRRVKTIVILSEEQLLEVMTLPIPPHGFLLRTPTGHLPVDRLALSLEGYIAGPGRLLGHLSRNLHRLRIVDRFTPEEMQILGHLGAGLQNRAIADLTGLAESRVKTVTHALTHKLRMKNRTAVAVFAATNGLSAKTGPRGRPG